MWRTNMKKTIFTILLILSLIASVYALVIPHAFYGTAKYSDDSPVPDGTVITAELNGNAVDTSTVQDGKYGYGDDTLIVTDDPEQGGTVTFHIGAVDADQEVTFQSGNATNLDLTFPGTAPAPETTPPEENNTGSNTDTNTGGETPGNNGGSPSTGDSPSSGGSSGGGGGSSSSSKKTKIKPTIDLADDEESDENTGEVSDLQEKTESDTLDGISGKPEANVPKNVLSNFLTGAFTGVTSSTAGKLGTIAGVFLLVILTLSLLHRKNRKKK